MLAENECNFPRVLDYFPQLKQSGCTKSNAQLSYMFAQNRNSMNFNIYVRQPTVPVFPSVRLALYFMEAPFSRFTMT